MHFEGVSGPKTYTFSYVSQWSLSQLSNLRTLHLRHGYSDPPLEEETTHGSNRLANYLLRTLYFLNPHNRLEALVIGQTEWHLDFNNVDEDGMKKYSTAHYCYLNAKVGMSSLYQF